MSALVWGFSPWVDNYEFDIDLCGIFILMDFILPKGRQKRILPLQPVMSVTAVMLRVLVLLGQLIHMVVFREYSSLPQGLHSVTPSLDVNPGGHIAENIKHTCIWWVLLSSISTTFIFQTSLESQVKLQIFHTSSANPDQACRGYSKIPVQPSLFWFGTCPEGLTLSLPVQLFLLW